ncbi:MAG: MFS transporter, partial [Chloroflexi bacterium]|nr:MFS transporter [Chloroflexota bacterium]
RFVRDGARSLMAVLAVIYLVEIGFSNAQVGIIFGFSLAGGFVVSVGVMLTSRVIPTRIWSVANMLILAVGGIVLILSNDFWFLILGGFFGAYAASGAHWGGMMQLEQTGIAAAIPQERRTRAYSNLSIGSSAGRAIGALLAGLSTLLIETFNWEPIAAYQAVLWLYVGLNVLAAAVYTLLSNAVNTQPSPSPRSAGGESKREPLFANPFKAKARRPILTMSSLFAFDSFAGGMVFDSFLSFWLFTKFDMSAAAIGAVLVAGQVLNMVSLVMAPWVAERIGLLNTLVFTQIFSNIMLILFAFAPSAIIAVTIWMFRSIADEMDVPTRQAYMMAIIEPSEHPIMAGTANLGRGLGRIPSATVTGWLWSGALTVVPWIAAGSIKLAYDFAIWLAFRRVKV